MTAAHVADRRLVQRAVTRIVVKRNNPTMLDTYGHWWVEIGDVESYGWWPAVRPVGITKALRGVPGVLNAVGVPEGGRPTVDPRHGELADHAFHPVNDGDRTDDEIIAAIRRFATTFDGGVAMVDPADGQLPLLPNGPSRRRRAGRARRLRPHRRCRLPVPRGHPPLAEPAGPPPDQRQRALS